MVPSHLKGKQLEVESNLHNADVALPLSRTASCRTLKQLGGFGLTCRELLKRRHAGWRLEGRIERETNDEHTCAFVSGLLEPAGDAEARAAN